MSSTAFKEYLLSFLLRPANWKEKKKDFIYNKFLNMDPVQEMVLKS